MEMVIGRSIFIMSQRLLSFATKEIYSINAWAANLNWELNDKLHFSLAVELLTNSRSWATDITLSNNAIVLKSG